MPARRRTVVGDDGVAWPKVSYIVRCRVKPVTKKQRVAREYYRRKKFAAVERYLNYMETHTRTTVRRRRPTKRRPTPRRAIRRKQTSRKKTRTQGVVRDSSSTYMVSPASAPVEHTKAPRSPQRETYKTTLYIPAKRSSSPRTRETPDRSFHMGSGKYSDDPQNEYD